MAIRISMKNGVWLRGAGLAFASVLALTACANQSQGKRPPPKDGERSVRTGFEGAAIRPVGLLIGSMDRNGDHRVDGAEFRAAVEVEWQALAQGGAPTALNYAQWSEQALGVRYTVPGFLSLDRDGSGGLSEREFTEFFSRQFATLDRDKDGIIVRSELVFVIQAPRSRGGGQGAGQGQGAGRGEGGGRGDGQRPSRR